MDLQLQGKCAIVTGGSRGIGKAIARALALEGVEVGIAARDPQRILEASEELSALTGRRVAGVSCDTGDDESVRAMVAALSSTLGGVDILVNAAAIPTGVTPPLKLGELTGDALWAEGNVKVMAGGVVSTRQEYEVAELAGPDPTLASTEKLCVPSARSL